MSHEYIYSLILQRFLYPILIAVCIILRPTILGAGYLALIIWLPYVPVAKVRRKLHHRTRMFLVSGIFISLAIVITQVVINIALPLLGKSKDRCTSLEGDLFPLGLLSLFNAFYWKNLFWLVPDVVMLLSSISMFVWLRKLDSGDDSALAQDQPLKTGSIASKPSRATVRVQWVFTRVRMECGMIALLLAAVMRPSLISIMYFVAFVFLATWRVFDRSTDTSAFAVLSRLVCALLAIHIALLFTFQLIPVTSFAPDGLAARLIGFDQMADNKCDPPATEDSDDKHSIFLLTFSPCVLCWLNICFLYACFHIVVLGAEAKIGDFKRRQAPPIEDTAATMLRRPPPPAHRPPPASRNLLMVHCLPLINNVVMMAWSIVFHGWLTFVFLVWANVLWIVPNQRKRMMGSSPFVVMYATLMMFLQFGCSLNWRRDELPAWLWSNTHLGFVVQNQWSMPPLLLQTLFMLWFWLTMQQHLREQREAAQMSSAERLRRDSVPMAGWKLRLWLLSYSLLLKVWMCLVLGVVLVLALWGYEITLLRIWYMIMFVVFVSMFQLSFYYWAKLMFAFWILLIASAMLQLIMIYLYQFGLFDSLGLSRFVQSKMIGLEMFEKTELFVHLLYPTIVVIMTMIQIRIFHSKYLQNMKFVLEKKSGVDEPTEPTASNDDEKTRDDKPTKSKCRDCCEGFWRFCRESANLFLMTVEFVVVEIVCCLAFYIAVEEVNAAHFGIAVLALIAAMNRYRIQLILCSVITVFISLLVTLKMIYQMDIAAEAGQVKCTADLPKSSLNMFEWFGFEKQTHDVYFHKQCKLYLVYLGLSIFNLIVCLKQMERRYHNHQPLRRPNVMFPEIDREHADDNILSMIKYLANYFFYRFSIEATLVMISLLIVWRMDIWSMFYMFWLVFLFYSSPSFRRLCWPIFILATVLFILFQYIGHVDVAPFYCVAPIGTYQFGFDDKYWPFFKPLFMVKHTLLMYDYLVLLIACHQYHAYRAEERSRQAMRIFIGGSNRLIADEPNFTVRRTRDFTTELGTPIDVLKRIVFYCLFWASLSACFITGARAVSIYSPGYLLGSFVFLWQGSDFYARPMAQILRWWKALISYVLLVICGRLLLQLPTCVFSPYSPPLCRWMRLFDWKCWLRTVGAEDESHCAGVVNMDERVFEYDVVCLLLLLLQLRLFGSPYFGQMVRDQRAMLMLKRRGIELQRMLNKRSIQVQYEGDEEMMHKIKSKVLAMKASQATTLNQPNTHHGAIYAGDYEMFKNDIRKRGAPHTQQVYEQKPLKRTGAILAKVFRKYFIILVLNVYRASARYRYYKRTLNADKLAVKRSESELRGEQLLSEQDLGARETEQRKPNFLLQSHWIVVDLLIALGIGIVANTEYVVYLFIVVYMLAEASVLALPLPLCMLLWGTLSRGGPSKSFWVVMIAYAQLLVLLKCFGHLDDQHMLDIFMVLDVRVARLTFDCLLLVAMFWHRNVQQDIGLWDRDREQPTVMGVYSVDTKMDWLQFGEPEVVSLAEAEKEAQQHELEFNSRSSEPLATEMTVISLQRAKLKYKVLDGVQIVKASQGKLKLHLTKVNVNKKTLVDSTQLVQVIAMPINPIGLVCKMMWWSVKKYCSSVTHFMQKLARTKKKRVTMDVYKYIFFVELVSLIVILFGGTAFTNDARTGAVGGIVYYVTHNRVPFGFLMMLLSQFFCIIIDRALYLRRQLIGKLIFYVINVITMHVLIFVVGPRYWNMKFHNSPGQMCYYVLKCIYYLFSAYQIRAGYPSRIFGNRMTTGYSILSRIFFEIYMAIPFLYELRTVTDWIWTETSLSIAQWLKFQDIVVNTYRVKSNRQMSIDFPNPRGKKASLMDKIMFGSLLFLLIVLMVFGPLILFTLGPSSSSQNIPADVQLELLIDKTDSLYSRQTSKAARTVHSMESKQYRRLTNSLSGHSSALDKLESFRRDNIIEANFNSSSESLWLASDIQIHNIITNLKANAPVELLLKVAINRESSGEAMTSKMSLVLSYSLVKNEKIKNQMIEILHRVKREEVMSTIDSNTVLSLTIPNLMPKLLHVESKKLKTLNFHKVRADDFDNTRDLRLRLELADYGRQKRWHIHEVCDWPEAIFTCDKDMNTVVLFHDDIETSMYWGKWGIIGIYLSVTVVIVRILRRLVVGNVHLVMYMDLPQADLVMQLCYDIAVVRSTGEFALEEDLYAKLLFLHRSPATLIEFTRILVPPRPLESYVIQPEETVDDPKIEMLRRKIEVLDRDD